MNNKIDIEEVARMAVMAALNTIDEQTGGFTNSPDGPCGDSLASNLHNTIQKALEDHYK